MQANDVITLYNSLKSQNITIWIDGGWAVDALLAKQTRPHSDLDIVVQKKDLDRLVSFLRKNNYHDVPRDDTCPHNFVMGDNQDKQIDIHVIVFDQSGNGIYGPKEKGQLYPAESLTGQGSIDGQTVKCISPKSLVAFHTGYTLRESDYHDVRALCKAFNIPLPKEYKK